MRIGIGTGLLRLDQNGSTVDGEAFVHLEADDVLDAKGRIVLRSEFQLL